MQSQGGVIVEVAKDPQFRTETIRATKLLKAPVETVFLALTNNRTAGDRITKETLYVFDPSDHIVLTKITLPWPLKNRHFITRNTTDRPGKGQIKVISKSVSYPLAEAQVGSILGTIHISEFSMTEVANGYTKVEMLLNADPNGKIPLFLLTRLQRSKPVDFFVDLESNLRALEVETSGALERSDPAH